MSKYIKVVDNWEGQLEIEEQKFLDGGVAGMIIRLNDMNGGHHMDTGFWKQWNEARSFCRMPYFVFNPWVSGKVNYDWLLANCPDSSSVAVDIEVVYPGMSQAIYTGLVNEFLGYASNKWSVKIYTGGGYLGLINPWPKNYDYWYARYPYVLYPDTVQNWTWSQFDSVADTLIWSNWLTQSTVGPIKLWQCTGDKLILPGTVKPLDVNLWQGTIDELKTWFGPKNIPLSLEDRLSLLEARVSKVERILGV